MSINVGKIQEARERIKGYVKRTPLLRMEELDSILGCQVYVKPENLQVTGSFKARGATNKLLSLTEEQKQRGIIAASSGNHAQGVAYAAKQLGIKATIVMPENAPQVKLEGTRALGAQVILYGFTSSERFKKADELINQYGYTLIHSYDDEELAAGQGTAGLEIVEDLPSVDYVIAPLGGGGLLSGVSTAVKEKRPETNVIGVEPQGVRRYSKSIELGEPIEVEMGDTLADGLRVVKPGKLGFEIIPKYVDQLVEVDDEAIKEAMKLILLKGKLVIEPSASVGIAAVLSGKVAVRPHEKVCFVFSGGNIDQHKLIELLT